MEILSSCIIFQCTFFSIASIYSLWVDSLRCHSFFCSMKDLDNCEEPLNNCIFMNFHSIWSTSQSTSWKLHWFWLVECFYDFSLSEGIFDSHQRKQESQPRAPGGPLEAKSTCSVAYYMCYSHEYTLCLNTLSTFFLDGVLFRTSLQGELPNHRKGKHYDLSLTVNCTISLGERTKERKRGKRKRMGGWEFGRGLLAISTPPELWI